MQNDKKIEDNQEVCAKVLEMVGKPDSFHMANGMNVYDNKFRVNIFVKE